MQEKNDSAASPLSRRLAVGTLLAAGGFAISPQRASASGATNNVIYATSYGVVADGVTNDAPALQSAIAALSNGYVLVLPAGTMALGSSGWSGILVSGLSNVRIQGNATGIKWLAAPSQSTGPIGLTGLRLYNCTNVVISDISINGNSIACVGLGLDTCTTCVVSRVEVYAHAGPGQFAACKGTGNSWRSCSAHDSTVGSSCRGYLLGNSNSSWSETNQFIEGCVARNNDATGFALEGVRAICVNNLSDTNKGAGFTSSTASGSPSTDHLFVANIGRANSFHGYQLDVWGPPAQRISLVGNNFSDNVNSGIYCATGIDITITGNTLQNNGATTGAAALLLYASSGILVADNVMEGDSTHGICISAAVPTNTLSDVVITNNRCVGSASATIWLEVVDGTSSLRRINVTGNSIHGGTYGLRLRSDASGSILDSITVANNIVDSTTTASYYFSDYTPGQTTNLRLVNNSGGNVSFNSNILPALNQGNTWNPKSGYGAAAPATGTWSAGDIVYNSAPTAGSYVGWVCTSSGIPGVWKGFGAISA